MSLFLRFAVCIGMLFTIMRQLEPEMLLKSLKLIPSKTGNRQLSLSSFLGQVYWKMVYSFISHQNASIILYHINIFCIVIDSSFCSLLAEDIFCHSGMEVNGKVVC